MGNYEGEQRVSRFQFDSKVKSFTLHQEASLAEALLHVLSPQLSTWHQMNHHTPTLGTWNNILLRAVGSACIWLQVHEDHSLNTRHPEGGKKKKHRHTLSFLDDPTHERLWWLPAGKAIRQTESHIVFPYIMRFTRERAGDKSLFKSLDAEDNVAI